MTTKKVKNTICAAFEEEKAQKNVEISEIKAGDHFEYKGIEWVCLDVENDAGNKTAFAVSSKIIANMPFNNFNLNYLSSCRQARIIKNIKEEDIIK